MYTREIESFGNSILNGLPLEVPAEEAVYVQRVMEAAYRSNDTGVTITL
jgi:predicted dehydrogenase